MYDCAHLGPVTGEFVPCSSCSKPGVALKLFSCRVFGQCTPARQTEGTPCCIVCNKFTPKEQLAPGGDQTQPAPAGLSSRPVAAPSYSPSKIRWAYGITTVQERRKDLLPRTIMSLRYAGFDRPRLFVDGCSSRLAASYEEEFHLHVTSRDVHVRTSANWTLALLELFSRQPTADRYAIFQDDLVTCRNVRPYLERQRMPERGYWNLFCFLDNDEYDTHRDRTWFEGATIKRQAQTTKQTGRGAVALVFSREGVVTLLSSRRFMERPRTVGGDILVDGGIVSAMNEAGWREWVHRPSLFQHMGAVSTIGHHPHPQSLSFVGEDYDAMSIFLREKGAAPAAVV